MIYLIATATIALLVVCLGLAFIHDRRKHEKLKKLKPSDINDRWVKVLKETKASKPHHKLLAAEKAFDDLLTEFGVEGKNLSKKIKILENQLTQGKNLHKAVGVCEMIRNDDFENLQDADILESFKTFKNASMELCDD
jgi:hypothetical protein